MAGLGEKIAEKKEIKDYFLSLLPKLSEVAPPLTSQVTITLIQQASLYHCVSDFPYKGRKNTLIAKECLDRNLPSEAARC